MRTERNLLVLMLLLVCLACAIFATQSPRPASPACPDGVCPLQIQDLPRGAVLSVAMDLPPELRTKNWGGGSCVHASTVNLLIWQGQAEKAAWWRATYVGGEDSYRLTERMEAAGLRYAHTGDMTLEQRKEFVRWCVRTRRGAGIFYKPNHAINLVHLDEQYAYLLDNNDVNYPERTGNYERVPLETFWSNWQGYGAFAWTMVYLPPPPNPWI